MRRKPWLNYQKHVKIVKIHNLLTKDIYMATKQEQYLHFDDEILLSCDNGIVIAADPIHTFAYVVDKASRNGSTGSAIFTVEPKQLFDATRRWYRSTGAKSEDDELLAHNDCMCSSPEEMKSLEKLKDQAYREREYNKGEQDRLKGHTVLYGQIIQLYNTQLRKYLCVDTGRLSEIERGHLRVDLTRLPGENGLFRVLPSFKIREVGEPVRISDPIALQSVKPDGFFTCGSTMTYSDVYGADVFNIRITPTFSSWEMHCYWNAPSPVPNLVAKEDSSQAKKTSLLWAGQTVRIYHKEIEGYVECQDDSDMVHLRRHIINPLKPEESNSASGFWQIELDDPLVGTKIRTNKPCRLRHAVSGAYLFIDPNNVTIATENGNVTYPMGLAPRPSFLSVHDPTLFNILPLSTKDGTGVVLGSYVRIQHCITGTWLHAGALSDAKNGLHAQHHRLRRISSIDDIYVPLNDDVHRHKITAPIIATKEFHHDDCFTLTLVQPTYLDTFNYVKEFIPSLKWFLKKPRNTENPDGVGKAFPINDKELKEMSEILIALTHFCTQSMEEDPVLRKGLPIEYHQAVLRNCNIIQMIVWILQIPFDLTKRQKVRKYLTPKQSLSPQSKHRSLNLSSSSHTENVVEHESIQAGEEPRLIIIMQLCYSLLRVFLMGSGEDVSDIHIHHQHSQLHEHQWYILGLVGGNVDFFASQLECIPVCVTKMLVELISGNEPLTRHITKDFVVVDKLISYLDTSIGNPEVAAGLMDLLGTLCYVNGRTSIRRNQDQIMRKMVERELLIGLKIVEGGAVGIGRLTGEAVGWHALHQVADQQLLLSIVSSLALLRRICTDGNEASVSVVAKRYTPFDVCLKALHDEQVPEEIRAEICDLVTVLHVGTVHTTGLPFSDRILEYEKLVEMPSIKSFQFNSSHDSENLKRFCMGFLSNHKNQFVEHTAVNKLTSSVLYLVDAQLKIGHYSQFSELRDLLRTITNILDGRMDCRNSEHITLLSRLGPDYQWEQRFDQTEMTLPIMLIRMQVLNIIEWIIALGLGFRVESLVYRWKEYESSETRREFSPISILEKIFLETKIVDTSILAPILKDLLKYKYHPLRRSVVAILHTLYNDTEDILDVAQDCIILNNAQEVFGYKGIKGRLEEFKALSKIFLSVPQKVLRLVGILEELIALSESNVVVDFDGKIVSSELASSKTINLLHRKIIINLNGHISMIKLLSSIRALRKNEPKFAEENLNLAKTCMECLALLCSFDESLQSEFVSEHLDLLIEIASYDLPIIESLNHICGKSLLLSNRIHERHIKSIINGSRGRFEYYRLLHELIKPSGKIVRKLQDSTVRALMEDRERYIPEFIPSVEHDHKHLRNFAELISLLACCSEDDNTYVLSICRSLWPIEDLVPIVISSNWPLFLRKCVLRFITSVYFWNTEYDVEHDSIIKNLMESIHLELSNLKGLDGPIEPDMLEWIFEGEVVFLQTLFEFHLTTELVFDKKFRALCNFLVDEAAGLVSIARGHLKYVDYLLRCMDSMINTSGFVAHQDPEAILAILRDALTTLSNVEQKNTCFVDVHNIRYREFIKALSQDEQVESLKTTEFHMLASHFQSEIDLKSVIDYLTDASVIQNDLKTEAFDIKTIQILENIPGEIIAKRAKATDIEDLERQKEATQNMLNNLNATIMAQNLLTSSSYKIFKASLKLMIVLLDGGNKQVQDTLEEYFLGTREERLFYCLYHQIESGPSGIKELEETGRMVAHRASRLHREGLLANTKSSYMRSMSQHVRIGLNHHSHRFIPVILKGHQMDSQKMDSIMSAEFLEAEMNFDVMTDIMRLLQLLCEGHNSNLQAYLRIQPDNMKSFDLIKSIVNYLHTLVPLAHRDNIRLMMQVLDTITETAQGCLENQTSIFNNKIVQSINVILQERYEHYQPSLVMELKSKAVICLLSLLEGDISENKPIFKDMASTLDLGVISQNMSEIYEQHEKNLNEVGVFRKLDSGFQYCMLIMTLMPAMSESKRKIFANNKAFEFFKKNTGSIEIVTDNGGIDKHLSRILFPIPEICKFLSPTTKEKFLWSVNRESASAKIEGFVAQSDLIIFEIEHEARISRHPYLSLLVGHDLTWQFTFAVTIALNALVLFCSVVSVETPWSLQASPECGSYDDVLRVVLGLVHLALWGFLTAEFAVIQLPVLFNRRIAEKMNTIEAKRRKEEGIMEKNPLLSGENALSKLSLKEIIEAISQEPKLIYHVFMFFCSFIGLTGLSSFYAIHLLDYVLRDRILQGVIASVTVNAYSLSRTALLGVIIVYIHSVIAYMFFRDDFDESKGLYCSSLLECFVTIISHGVRSGGGIGDILEPPTENEPFVWRTIFEMSFFLIVIIFLLNAIFGQILDTFGHLRDERNTVLQDMRSACFICSVQASEFQRHAEGFYHHVKNDHNIWQYLFFFVHLKTKDRTDYTSQESYVADCLAEQDVGFFPINRALCLNQNDSLDDSEKLEKLEEIVQGLVDKVHRIEDMTEKIIESRRQSHADIFSPI